jgi:predicted nucleic acid-binding Zn ribbon protein
MERRKAEFLGDVVMRFLRQSGLESPLNEYRLMASWGEVAGAAAQRYTQNVYIRNQRLHVKLRSAVLRAELMMRRADLVEKLNGRVGAQVITDICFY